MHNTIFFPPQDVSEFILEPTSGEIRTRERIDREALGAEGRFDLVVISSTPTYPIEVAVEYRVKLENGQKFKNCQKYKIAKSTVF